MVAVVEGHASGAWQIASRSLQKMVSDDELCILVSLSQGVNGADDCESRARVLAMANPVSQTTAQAATTKQSRKAAAPVVVEPGS